MWKKIVIGLILLLLILGVLVRIGVPYYAKHQLTSALASADSASYSFLDIDMWNGDIIVKDIYLADTNGNLARQPVFLQLDIIKIKGGDIWKAYRKRILDISELELGHGFVNLSIPHTDSIETDIKSIKKILIHQININTLRIDSIGFNLGLNAENKQEAYAGVLYFFSDSVSIPLTKEGSFHHVNTLLKLDQIYAQPHKSIAYFTVDSLRFSSKAKKLDLHKIKMQQRIEQNLYANHFGFDKDFITLDIYAVTITGIPRKLQSIADGIHLSKVTVLGPEAYIYKDRRLPHPENEKKFIVEALSEVDIPIRLDTVQLTDGQLYFNENWRYDHVPGEIYLSDMQATMYNLNNRGPTDVGNWTVIDADITMYNKLHLGVDWEFDLRTNGRAFVLDIDIGSTSFSTLNPFTENTVGVRFRKGYLHGGRLYVEADKKSGAGTLDLFYSDLKVKFLDRETHETNFINWAEGGIANLAVKNNNLRDRRAKRGIVYAEPILDRAIFGYVIRLFFSGFKDIALTSKNKHKVAERGMKYIEIPAESKDMKKK
jgi:hypothetical protein